jgi:alkanesulfonate monooxygenase SsuD/methylene tetrahydromethanopterin reductase-like flavin-dependent oxidoreductase (luciferase family)
MDSSKIRERYTKALREAEERAKRASDRAESAAKKAAERRESLASDVAEAMRRNAASAEKRRQKSADRRLRQAELEAVWPPLGIVRSGAKRSPAWHAPVIPVGNVCIVPTREALLKRIAELERELSSR